MKQFFIVSGGRVVAAVLQAGMLAYLAREIGPHSFGEIGPLVNLVLISQFVLSFGLPSLVVYERARDRLSTAVGSILRLNLVTSLATSVFLSAVVVGAATVASRDIFQLLPLAFSAAAERVADARVAVAFADGDVHIESANLSTRRVVAAIALVLLVVVGVPPILAYSLGALVAALLSAATTSVLIRRRVPHGATVNWRILLREARSFWLAACATQAQNLDVLAVGLTGGALQSGYYATVSRLTNPLNLVPQTIARLLMRRSAGSPAGASSVRRGLVWQCVWLSALVAAGFLFLSLIIPWVFPLVLGQAYDPSIPAAQVLCLGLPFAGLATTLSGVLQGFGGQPARIVGWSALLSISAGLILCAVAAAVVGAWGAAAAFGLSQLAQAMFLFIFAFRSTRSAVVS